MTKLINKKVTGADAAKCQYNFTMHRLGLIGSMTEKDVVSGKNNNDINKIKFAREEFERHKRIWATLLAEDFKKTHNLSKSAKIICKGGLRKSKDKVKELDDGNVITA